MKFVDPQAAERAMNSHATFEIGQRVRFYFHGDHPAEFVGELERYADHDGNGYARIRLEDGGSISFARWGGLGPRHWQPADELMGDYFSVELAEEEES